MMNKQELLPSEKRIRYEQTVFTGGLMKADCELRCETEAG
jgi:hypothetical protein